MCRSAHVNQNNPRLDLAVNVFRVQVREAVRNQFAKAGWDVKTNSATREDPPTLEELCEFLDGTIDVLDTFDPPIGRQTLRIVVEFFIGTARRLFLRFLGHSSSEVANKRGAACLVALHAEILFLLVRAYRRGAGGRKPGVLSPVGSGHQSLDPKRKPRRRIRPLI